MAAKLSEHIAANLERRAPLMGGGGAEEVSQESVPDSVRDTLRALGYVQ